MIHYHGTPMTPDTIAIRVLTGRHAFVSFAAPQQIRLASDVCQSFALDNGAFSAWLRGVDPDWPGFYAWCEKWLSHPACDWAIIPDMIDGDEAANDALLEQWPFSKDRGVPVWHMHESISRLNRLCHDYPRVALGSSGEFATVGNGRWWARMNRAMNSLCGIGARPPAKLHGLRMLDPDVFTRIPFASADSTNIARNVGMDSRWLRGSYQPASKETRGAVMAERIEQFGSPDRWAIQAEQEVLL